MSLVNYDYSDDEESSNLPTTSKSQSPDSNGNKAISDSVLHVSEVNSKNRSLSFNSSSLSSLTFKNIKKSNAHGKRIQIKAFDNELIMNSGDSDDSDEEKKERKRMKKSEKGSSLILMLPKPKNVKIAKSKASLTSLIPSSVSNRTNIKTTTKTSNISTSFNTKRSENEVTSNLFLTDSDDDNDIEYRMDNHRKEPELEAGDSIDRRGYEPSLSFMNSKSSSSQAYIDELVPIYGPLKPDEASFQTYLDPNDDVTYKKYIASKFDDNTNNIKIIDVNLSQHLSENKEYLKNISLEKDIKDEDLKAKAPNSTARRKNQITFLAYQAKKRELELKNQWAQNRLSKSQTRAKYGF